MKLGLSRHWVSCTPSSPVSCCLACLLLLSDSSGPWLFIPTLGCFSCQNLNSEMPVNKLHCIHPISPWNKSFVEVVCSTSVIDDLWYVSSYQEEIKFCSYHVLSEEFLEESFPCCCAGKLWKDHNAECPGLRSVAPGDLCWFAFLSLATHAVLRHPALGGHSLSSTSLHA